MHFKEKIKIAKFDFYKNNMIANYSLDDFYQRNGAPLPGDITKEIGHFNVFEAEKLFDKKTGARIMPYSRRAYYKVSWYKEKAGLNTRIR